MGRQDSLGQYAYNRGIRDFRISKLFTVHKDKRYGLATL
jgi:hypothetical protein